MPDSLSMFTPCGMLELSSAPSYGEVIYTSMVKALSAKGAFDMTAGTRMEAWAYATAMALARAKYALDRAGNQAHAASAYDLIPILERAYLVAPIVGASASQRAAVLAAIEALAPGGAFPSIAVQLQKLLGSDFLALLRTSDIGTPTVYPSSPGSGAGNWVDQRSPMQWLQLVDPVASTGTQWVAYQSLNTAGIVTSSWQGSGTYAVGTSVVPLAAANGFTYQCTTAGTTGSTEPVWPTTLQATVTDGTVTWTCASTTSPALLVGQTLTVQGDCTGQAERVTVLAAAMTPPAGSMASPGLCFQATFTKAHDIGASLVTGPFPYWWSTQRQLMVVLSASAATNRDKRRQLDELLRKPVRGVDTWAAVAATTSTVTGGTVGPVYETTPLGTAPLGSFAFVGTP